jgi:hypothetical protein
MTMYKIWHMRKETKQTILSQHANDSSGGHLFEDAL